MIIIIMERLRGGCEISKFCITLRIPRKNYGLKEMGGQVNMMLMLALAEFVLYHLCMHVQAL